jgi:hypothetical protein
MVVGLREQTGRNRPTREDGTRDAVIGAGRLLSVGVFAAGALPLISAGDAAE